jgi:hypothetical protein
MQYLDKSLILEMERTINSSQELNLTIIVTIQTMRRHWSLLALKDLFEQGKYSIPMEE